MSLACPLCHQSGAPLFHEDKKRPYQRCQQCYLVFVPQSWHLSAAAEKAEYDLHENSVDDLGYRTFLTRVFAPLCERLEVGSEGLDFGCGPGPALAAMFREAGFSMALYDKFYAPDATVLSRQYDFICCTEVIEHIADPATVLPSLLSCLRPGGWLGVMTKQVIDQQAFARWHYKNDPTHIAFYSRETFEWLAQQFQLELHFIDRDVVLLQKVVVPKSGTANH